MSPAGRAILPVLLTAAVVAAGCSGDREGEASNVAPEGAPQAAPVEEALEVVEEEEAASGFLSPENQRRVLLFFPSGRSAHLIPEQRITFLTRTQTSQIKQAVSELIAGPVTEGLLQPFPVGTSLRAVFLPGNGIAVLDLGLEGMRLPAGSDWEQAALFSLVNTVLYNFPDDLTRVQVLVDGSEVATLAGHLDTSRPMDADLTRVDWASQRLLDDDGNFLPYDPGPLPDDEINATPVEPFFQRGEDPPDDGDDKEEDDEEEGSFPIPVEDAR